MREAGAWRAPPRGGGSFAERLKRIMLWGVGVGLEREGWVEEKRDRFLRGGFKRKCKIGVITKQVERERSCIGERAAKRI